MREPSYPRSVAAGHTVGAVLLRDGMVLLGLRAGHKTFAGSWDIIGGHIEPGETIWSALRRELGEEPGITDVDGIYLESMNVAGAGGQSSILHVFSVSDWRGEPVNGTHEHDEVRWFGLMEAARRSDLAIPAYRRLFASLMRHPCRHLSQP